MHRLLRLLTLWLIALALPIQGAAAATAMALPMSRAPMAHAPQDATPCPNHAMHHAAGHASHHSSMERSGCCGACCGPVACQQATLAVAPVAETWAPAARAASPLVAPQFLTDGPDRPPRPVLA
jgi:hypothetical protein